MCPVPNMAVFCSSLISCYYYYYYYYYWRSNYENILKGYAGTYRKLCCSGIWGETKNEGNAYLQGKTDKHPSEILS
jgi:hypothetical protein